MINTQKYALRSFICFILIFCSGDLRSISVEPDAVAEKSDFTLSKLNVKFKGEISEKVRQCFLRVLGQYPALHNHEIEVKQRQVSTSTMQAQPKFSFRGLFGGEKKYIIKLGKYVKDSDNIAIEDLSEDVICGWFAHELGHLMDYEEYSGGQMLWYGIKYVTSGKFRRHVEYEADYIALKTGFYEEILAAKRFILENDLGEEYIDKIKEFYLSIEDVQAYAEDESLFHSDEEDEL